MIQKKVIVEAVDTDVYVPLLYHYLGRGLNIPMVMQLTKKGRAVVDITATVKKYASLIPTCCQHMSGKYVK